MARNRFLEGALQAGSQTWRQFAPGSLRKLAMPVAAAIAERRIREALATPSPEPMPGPLVVSGLFSESKGISEAARLTVAGLEAAGLSVHQHDLRPVLQAGLASRADFPVEAEGGAWIVHVNAPEAVRALAVLDPAQWRGRYRIGYWAYELPRLPASWVRAASAFDELWAPSRFVAEAMTASGIATAIHVMPHPVALRAEAGTPDRGRFRIPAGDFVVLATGDLRSSAARKNLVGAIEIFAKAFASPDDGGRLVLKVQSLDAHPGFRLDVERAAAGRRDIILMADALSNADMRRLLACCDVLLSPHRSEGFGLTLAEVFLLGVPALATGWSGNLDFMSDLPELLIDYRLVPVRDPYGVYPQRNLSWAEPDLGDGAAKLRKLYASSDLRRTLADRGKAAVEAQLEAWSPKRLRASAWGRLVL